MLDQRVWLRHTDMGTGTMPGIADMVTDTMPVYLSGTFNVQRPTLNVQEGDRKGAWWPGYGDRHGIWAAGILPPWTCPSAGRAVPAGRGAQIWGQTLFSIY